MEYFGRPEFYTAYSGEELNYEEISDVLVALEEPTPEILLQCSHILRTCTDKITLENLLSREYIQESGILTAILDNPLVTELLINVGNLANVSDVPLDVIPAVRVSQIYAYLVTSTEDIEFIEQANVNMEIPLYHGYVREDFDFTQPNLISKFYFDLPCIYNVHCSDKLCLKIIELYKASESFLREENSYQHRYGLHMKTLAARRPWVWLNFRRNEEARSGKKMKVLEIELALITDARYFDYDLIDETNILYIFTYTPLVEVIEYILANYDILTVLAEGYALLHYKTASEYFYHSDGAMDIPPTKQIGYLKYLLKHQREKRIIITTDHSLAEVEVMLLFPNVEVREVDNNVIVEVTTEMIVRLRELNYDFSNHEEYMASLKDNV
jgi:hypothetical protein